MNKFVVINYYNDADNDDDDDGDGTLQRGVIQRVQ